MKELPNTSIDYYILPNKIFCSMVGMWPLDEKCSKSSKIFAYFRLVVTVISYSSIFVPQIWAIAVNWGDIQTTAEIGITATSVGQALYKIFYLIARRGKAHKLYNEMRSLWDSTDDPNEKKSYEQIAYWARIVTITFYTSLMCNVISFTISGIIDYLSNNDRHLPFDVWYGTDISASPKFEIIFLCQLLACTIGTSGLTAIDCSIMTIILHVAGQFKLIKTWMNKIGTEINREPVHLEKFEIDLFKCIRHHQRIIHVVNDINNLFTPILFMQFLTSGIEICLSGYSMLGYKTAIIDVLKFVFYFISMMVEILLFCWPSEILVQESEEVGHVIYFNVPWYKLSPIHRRHLCLMIIRAQRYCSITALTFKTLSFQTLTSVFNTAASYFTLLRQMQQDQIST
ncbi:hypothetical protein QLX08_010046 [Tetragonisca angustula]|uniref:Odorant receptor n=1 Tax=Tetragonisca angustula TaxID=166442 RepID=A0AAW0ZDT3_9HYME